MGLLDILKSIYNVFCVPSEPTPPSQQQPQPPVHHPGPPIHHPSPPIHHPSPKPQPHEDQNQINQQSDFYVSLRAQANEHGDRMARCFDESQQAYTSGDGARAKQLSNDGKAHKAQMEELNRQASEWIFRGRHLFIGPLQAFEVSPLYSCLRYSTYEHVSENEENNKDSGPGEVDLHGLYVKEAITFTDRAIEEAKRRGDSEVRLIVGKGLHSAHGAKIKPAVEDLMTKHRLRAAVDPDNAGVLIVQLNAGGQRGLGADELTRRIERDDERCIIM